MYHIIILTYHNTGEEQRTRAREKVGLSRHSGNTGEVLGVEGCYGMKGSAIDLTLADLVYQ